MNADRTVRYAMEAPTDNTSDFIRQSIPELSLTDRGHCAGTRLVVDAYRAVRSWTQVIVPSGFKIISFTPGSHFLFSV